MAESPIELIQFRRSHFNEKARWALDFKRVPYRRTTLLPGPHARTMQKLTGQRMVPAVRFEDGIVSDSSRIIDELERRYPTPALYPEDPTERKQALEVQAYFDASVGPSIRAALFSTLMTQGTAYASQIFGDHLSTAKRMGYTAMMRVGGPAIHKQLQLDDPAVVQQALDATLAGLDYVVKHAGPDGHLVGSKFSIADLSASALLALSLDLDHPDMSLPRPRPPLIEAWYAKWAPHPGTDWVRETYRRHRPQPTNLS